VLDGVKASKLDLWRPFMFRPITRTLLAVVLVIFIAGIEVMRQVSKSRNGLFAYPATLAIRYVWVYFFPLAFFILGAALQAFDFAARGIAFLTAFRRNPQPASLFATYNPLYQTAVTMLWHATVHRQFIALASTVSIMLLPLLKIAVAGLFVVQSEWAASTFTTDVLTGFNATLHIDPSAYTDNPFHHLDAAAFVHVGPLVALTQLPQFGLELPSWTTSEYAIGEADLSQLASLSSDVRVVATLSILYPEVTCSMAPASDYKLVADPLPSNVVGAMCVNGSGVSATNTQHWQWFLPAAGHSWAFLMQPCDADALFAIWAGTTISDEELYNSSSRAIDAIADIQYAQCYGAMIRYELVPMAVHPN
jgi:hypothetical protein